MAVDADIASGEFEAGCHSSLPAIRFTRGTSLRFPGEDRNYRSRVAFNALGVIFIAKNGDDNGVRPLAARARTRQQGIRYTGRCFSRAATIAATLRPTTARFAPWCVSPARPDPERALTAWALDIDGGAWVTALNRADRQ
jgi:hypothetical protein